MSDSLIIARPDGPPQQLVLLFHGVGATPEDMAPLGRILAAEFPSAFVVSVLINPDVYEAVGLDRGRAVREARGNPYNHETRRWLGEKIMGFLGEQGMVTWNAKPIYKLAHLI